MRDRDADRCFARYARAGDPEALAEVFDRVAPELLRVAMHLAAQPSEAEDLLQATFLTAIESSSRWDETRPVLPWLIGILGNLARRARGRRRPAPLSGVERPDPGDPPDLAAERKESSRELRRAIDELPEPYRRALLLRLTHGLEPIEIAHLFDVPPPTARSWIRRGIERLRKALPAGLGVAGAIVLPSERGLAAVREAVLAHATSKATIAGAAALAGGTVVMKKLLLASLALLVLAGGSAWVLSPSSVEPTRPASRQTDALDAREAPERLSEPGGAAPLDFAMVDRERDLHGAVVDTEGRGVPGARVLVCLPVWRSPHAGSWNSGAREGPETRTGADGSFRLRLEPGAEIRLCVGAPGYATVTLPEVQAGERVRVVLPRAASLLVRVRDEEGSPVAGAELHLEGNEDREWVGEVRQETDESGICRLDGLPPGWKLRLTVLHAAFARVDRMGVSIPEVGTCEVEVVLRPGRRLSGRVLDAETGSPIPGAEVSDGARLPRIVRTDTAGDFLFAGFPAEDGEPHLLVRAGGYAPLGVGVHPGDERLELSLQRAASIRGRVVDRAGAVVAGARVSAGGSMLPGRFESHGLTDEEHPERSRIALSYDYEPPGAPGREVDFGDVVLGSGGTVAGRVLATDGTPLVGASVSLLGGNFDRTARRPGIAGGTWGPQEHRRSDDLGRFRFGDLAPGAYRLSVHAPGGDTRSAPAVIERPGQVVSRDVAFGAGHAIHVIVTDDGGRPVSGISVWTRTAAGESSVVTDDRGEAVLRVEGEVDTMWVFGLEEDWLSPWTHSGRPVDAAAAEVRFVLLPAAEISGLVVGPDGLPVGGASVRSRVAEGRLERALTDEEGRFVLSVPARGPFDLEADRGALAGTLGDVVAGGADPVIRLQPLPTDRSLSVLVEDPDGGPVEGVLVSFQAIGQFSVLRTDATGRVTFEGLPARRGWLMTQGGGPGPVSRFANPARVVVMPEGQEGVLRFRRTVEISGRVQGEDGKPFVGARVYGVDPKMHDAFGGLACESDEEGRFTVRVPAGLGIVTLHVAVGAPGRIPEKSGSLDNVRPGATGIVLRLGEDR